MTSREGEFAAVVERVMSQEGWVCDPANHDDLPVSGECITCDGERHQLGVHIYQEVCASDWLLDLLAATWDEGWKQGATDVDLNGWEAHDLGKGPHPANPYRKERS